MGCRKRNIRKDDIEAEVLQTLRDFLTHPELLADIAAWAADYYKNELGGSSCIGSLRTELKETETALSNILKAIEAGIFNDMTQNRMLELQSRQETLAQSILIEEANAELFEDEGTFEEYLCRYANANLCDEETRTRFLSISLTESMYSMIESS
ncbi:hypothetical protein [Parafannyhessea umbonata]|uniref:hypothetical protein n=1 Tax=Parafannyhessea umbonata TaxID=604330 RepID=UPI000B886F65|nr:hypothetical protein [Parafannyhessea umbonata]